MEQSDARKAALAALVGGSAPPARIKESAVVNSDWERVKMRVWLTEYLKDPSKHPAAVLVELNYATPEGAAALAEQWSRHPFIISRKESYLQIFESQSIHTRDSVIQEAWNFYHACKDEEVKLNLLKKLMEITGVVENNSGGAGSVINNIAIAIQQVKDRRLSENRIADIA